MDIRDTQLCLRGRCYTVRQMRRQQSLSSVLAGGALRVCHMLLWRCVSQAAVASVFGRLMVSVETNSSGLSTGLLSHEPESLFVGKLARS